MQKSALVHFAVMVMLFSDGAVTAALKDVRHIVTLELLDDQFG